MIKTYTTHISEGKTPIFLSILFAILIRTAFFFNLPAPVPPLYGDSYVWDYISPYFYASPILSYTVSFAFAIIIALLVAHINTKHSLIRKRTNLPFSFTVLLLSCHPDLAIMTSTLIGVLFLLLSLNKLFDCQQKKQSPRIAFDFGFLIALGSVVLPDILIYLPLFWIGLIIMRVFSFKSIMTSLLGIVFVYWIILFFFLSKDNLEGFYYPVLKWAYWGTVYSPFSGYDHINFGSMGVSILMLLIMVVSDYNESNRDKIRTRANLAFIQILLFVSIAFFLLIPFKPTITLGVAMVTGAITAAHFFALAKSRWKVYLFYISFALLVSYSFFLFLK